MADKDVKDDDLKQVQGGGGLRTPAGSGLDVEEEDFGLGRAEDDPGSHPTGPIEYGGDRGGT